MDLKKKGFHLPESIRFDEESLTGSYGELVAEPLERGFGTTLGNSLRRVLLSSLEGGAVTAVKIDGVLHEFSTLAGVKEEIIEIVLNIKQLRVLMHVNGPRRAEFKVKGPAVVTAKDIKINGDAEIVNIDQHIATVSKGATFKGELIVKKGKGFVTSELNKSDDLPVDAIAVDSIFSPVKKVNFRVENARVGRSTDYDRLVMEIWTDGTITPQRALSQAAEIIIEHSRVFVLESEQEEDPLESEYKDYGDDPVFNENLLRNVDELELSVRAQNCLKNANISSISELVQRTEQDMLRTKNFGRKSLNEIKEILITMGLRFGMRVDEEALENLRKERGPNAS